MYLMNKDLFFERLREKGYLTVGEFARTLGLHRNTISYYLSGRGIFPVGLQKVLRALDLKPAELIVEQNRDLTVSPSIVRTYELLYRLHLEFPLLTFVLFGSRARQTAHTYSDWDVGVYSTTGISQEDFLKVVRRGEELAEKLPYFLNIVNLNEAPESFLRRISKDWKFLNGQNVDWMSLQRRMER